MTCSSIKGSIQGFSWETRHARRKFIKDYRLAHVQPIVVPRAVSEFSFSSEEVLHL